MKKIMALAAFAAMAGQAAADITPADVIGITGGASTIVADNAELVAECGQSIDGNYAGTLQFDFTMEVTTLTGDHWGGLQLVPGGNLSAGLGVGFSWLAPNWGGWDPSQVGYTLNGTSGPVALAQDDPQTFKVVIDYVAGGLDTATITFQGTETVLPAEDYSCDTVQVRGGNAAVMDFTNMNITQTIASPPPADPPPPSDPLLLLEESFTGYSAGNLPGQTVAVGGFASGSTWEGLDSGLAGSVPDASVISEGNLVGQDLVVTSPQSLQVKGDASNTRVSLDVSAGGPFDLAGLRDAASSTIGGGSIYRRLYCSFLFRAVSTDRNNEFGGIQLVRSGSGFTGPMIGNEMTAWAYTMAVPPYSTFENLKDYGGTGNFLTLDNQVHLIVSRIDFHTNGYDKITTWVDPELLLDETKQSRAGVYTGSAWGDFSFDQILFRGGNGNHPFEYDELRIGTTWGDVTPVAAPALVLTNDSLRATVRADGSIAFLEAQRSGAWEEIPFRDDSYRGPAWKIDSGSGPAAVALARDPGQPSFTGTLDGQSFRLTYGLDTDGLHVTARAENPGGTAWQPVRASLNLGINTYMATYPEWRDLYFPTLLRCEPTHFWGYMMSPNENILAMGSPDPIASWNHVYEPGRHRIYTSVLDLLESEPVPTRHPQGQDTLAAGESREWTLTLFDASSLDAVKPGLATVLSAPMIDASRYTGEPGETVEFTIHGGAASATVTPPGGSPAAVSLVPGPAGSSIATVTLPATYGGLVFRATNADGRTAEAVVNIRRPWSWVMQQARAEAIAKPQKASSNTESWYGLYSGYLAGIHFPDAAADAAIEAKFNELYPLMYDPTTGLPVPNAWEMRIQNHSAMAGLLVDRYKATGDIDALEKAAALCDFLITVQGADGAYYGYGGAYYTSVLYMAKSVLEVVEEEAKLADGTNIWQERHDRHLASATAAIDDLAVRLDNIGTEGQPTFEDGMISCSGTQLAMMALRETDPDQKAIYIEAARHFIDSHQCLDQLLIPDGRMNGATLRFWEGQYDILSSSANYMNSAHGWSAWRIYGIWYLYQLTGEVRYLRETMDALGTCTQLIDPTSGELRWSFVSDPRVRMALFTENAEAPGTGTHIYQTLGEQYLPMISGWWRAPPNTWVHGYAGNDGGCCDNDVHEIFKCLEEVALTSAYAVFHDDGSVETWNCQIADVGGTSVLRPNEDCVARLHVHTAAQREVTIDFQGQLVTRHFTAPGWVAPDAADQAYHDWRVLHFGDSYAQVPAAMDLADGDGDGVPTRLEFLIDGRSPLVAEPMPDISPAPDGEFLKIRVPRRSGALPPAALEWSGDLSTWLPPAPLPDNSLRVYEDATSYEVWIKPDVHPHGFFRLWAEEPTIP